MKESSVQAVGAILMCMVIVEKMEIHSASTAGKLMLRNATDVRLNARNSESVQLSMTRCRVGI